MPPCRVQYRRDWALPTDWAPRSADDWVRPSPVRRDVPTGPPDAESPRRCVDLVASRTGDEIRSYLGKQTPHTESFRFLLDVLPDCQHLLRSFTELVR